MCLLVFEESVFSELWSTVVGPITQQPLNAHADNNETKCRKNSSKTQQESVTATLIQLETEGIT